MPHTSDIRHLHILSSFSALFSAFTSSLTTNAQQLHLVPLRLWLWQRFTHLSTMITAPGSSAQGLESELQARRAALAGTPGARGLVQNARTTAICVFASLGGLIYGFVNSLALCLKRITKCLTRSSCSYNQGAFGQILSMNSFSRAAGTDGISNPTLVSFFSAPLVARIDLSPLSDRPAYSRLFLNSVLGSAFLSTVSLPTSSAASCPWSPVSWCSASA